jgi:hypothetical protein
MPFGAPGISDPYIPVRKNRYISYYRHIKMLIYGDIPLGIPLKLRFILPSPLKTLSFGGPVGPNHPFSTHSPFRSLENCPVPPGTVSGIQDLHSYPVQDLRPEAQPPVYIHILMYCRKDPVLIPRRMLVGKLLSPETGNGRKQDREKQNGKNGFFIHIPLGIGSKCECNDPVSYESTFLEFF